MSGAPELSCVEAIAKLNAQVASKCEAVYAAKERGEEYPKYNGEMSPEFVAVKNGATVYHNRYEWMVLVLMMVAAGLAAQSWIGVGGWAFAACAFSTFILYDIFSGVLHIVLDHPGFINMPLLGPACLEFQWHHHIPMDIASKPYLQACGDLNMVAVILTAWYGLTMSTPLGLSLAGFKLLWSYFGQLCHRMAHMPKARRPAAVVMLQDMGFMLSQATHNNHHRTYDNAFCIGSGWGNPSLNFLVSKIMASPTGWLCIFVFASLADVMIVRYCLSAALTAMYGHSVV